MKKTPFNLELFGIGPDTFVSGTSWSGTIEKPCTYCGAGTLTNLLATRPICKACIDRHELISDWNSDVLRRIGDLILRRPWRLRFLAYRRWRAERLELSQQDQRVRAVLLSPQWRDKELIKEAFAATPTLPAARIR